MANDTWQQISGDVTASEYGATFGQLDTLGDRVYGVRVVVVTNMEDATGTFDAQEGKYLTESSYVDVDGMEWYKARRILDSHGLPETDNIPTMPEAVQERYDWCKQRMRDLHDLAVWGNRAATQQESDEVHLLLAEMRTYREWFNLDRMARAEMAVSYGGYTDGQALYFHTLKSAMDYHGIPSSALWHASEYDAGIVHLKHDADGALTDSEGNGTSWHHYDMRGYLDTLEDVNCENCGVQLDSEAYICLDGGDAYCVECVTVD